uniref:Ig-like domain-containing protein n=1 Tax=Labrus bergylta TaxID=56723 RepID=A0A3Q3EW28_9LABR
ERRLLGNLEVSPRGEDRVIQPTEDVFASEGDTVTLDCQFETSMTPYLFWYRQEMGSIHPTDSDFSAYINKTEKRVNLEISSAALTDSAVYYCALQPTVTGNTTTLYKNLWREDNTILHNIH